MSKTIKEIRNTIAGHQILIFDDESSYTLTRGEHEVLKFKVGDEYPPIAIEATQAPAILLPGNDVQGTATDESKPAQEQSEKLEPAAAAPEASEEKS